jgi:hypothetical protein
VLLAEGPEKVLTRDGSSQPFLAALERAEALQALAGRDWRQQHQQLVDVLLLHDPGSLTVRGTALQDWARHLLDMLLVDPQMAAVHEQAAVTRLAVAPVDEALLRAFADTDALQDWLRNSLDDDLAAGDGLGRKTLRLLAWIYRHGADERPWPEVDALTTTELPVPVLPESLEALVSIRLDGNWLLHVQRIGDAAYAFLQAKNQNLCHIVRIDRDGSRLVKQLPFFPGGDGLPNMQKFCYPTADGLAIVFQGQWLHLRPDGSKQLRQFSYAGFELAPPVRIGSMLGVLLRGADHLLRVEVLNLATGVSVMAYDLDARADRPSALVANDRWLFLLQHKSTMVRRIDLHRFSEPVLFALPVALNYSTLHQARAFEDGVALPSVEPGRGVEILVVKPDLPAVSIPLGNREVGTVEAESGIAWWTRPQRDRLSGAGPMTLNWLAPGAKRPWAYAFPVASVRLLQASQAAVNAPRPRDRQLLTVFPGARDRVELHCMELGASTESWVLQLPEVPYSTLTDPFTAPQRAADGWVVLLREMDNRRAGARIHVVAIDDSGKRRGSYSVPSVSRSRYSQALYLLDRMVLLRDGDILTLLGKP